MVHCVVLSRVTHVVTHLVWPHRPEDLSEQYTKNPVFVSLILLDHPLKALMLVAPTAC